MVVAHILLVMAVGALWEMNWGSSYNKARASVMRWPKYTFFWSMTTRKLKLFFHFCDRLPSKQRDGVCIFTPHMLGKDILRTFHSIREKLPLVWSTPSNHFTVLKFCEQELTCTPHPEGIPRTWLARFAFKHLFSDILTRSSAPCTLHSIMERENIPSR